MMTFKDRLHQPGILVAPGIYDALTAHLAAKAGFEAVFLSGSAVAFSQLCQPDIGLVTMTEMALACDRVRDRTDLHIMIDADSGYGNAYNVARCVRTFERAGASGIQIEDQLNTKNVEEVAARPLVSTETMVGKIKAALDARTHEGTVISARSDAAFTEGVDKAIARAAAYKDAGAEMIFVEGLTKRADMEALHAALGQDVPTLYNVLDPAKTEVSAPADLDAIGYAMMLYPATAITAAANGALEALKAAKDGMPSVEGTPIKTLIENDPQS
ncbi:MAG: isocitrate lyase/PEP mutase family protein [Pseudomonadota bacterium]